MSINDVSLFGTIVEDIQERKSRAGRPYATFKVRTYKYVRDRLTGQPKEHSDVHEVQCYDETAVPPLAVHGKAGAWVRIRGEVAYKDGGGMFVRVPPRGGMATVSTYFGTDITPFTPVGARVSANNGAALQQSSTPEAMVEEAGADPHGMEVDHGEADDRDLTAGASGIDQLHADAERTSSSSQPSAGANLDDGLTEGSRKTATVAQPNAGHQSRLPAAGARRPTAAPAPSAETKQAAASVGAASSPGLPRRLPGGLPRAASSGLPPRPTAGSTQNASKTSTSKDQKSSKGGAVLTADDIPFSLVLIAGAVALLHFGSSLPIA